MAEKRKVSQICWLLLAVLQFTAPSSAQDATTSSANSTDTSAPKNVSGYRTLPTDVRVAVGEPAEFRCGVPEASKSLTFTFYSSHGNYTLSCPNGKVEDIPQAPYGRCEVKGGELVAIWTLKGTSYSDNDTLVVCHQSNDPEDCSAVLHVYDKGASYATLVGCVIGGFFGVLLIFGLIFLLMPKSMTIQNCLDEEDIIDDLDSIVKE
ncbi:uncharacterized protein LOC116717955 [Xiphophorus hellerii]|uniref:uncharacterized protein LOC116717955 n=1 Tax=Xiphophorus hellerii TaxID=8084 RepID=UPI0013B3D614|nr:uncharacterized protein LOC116717955 [Xiphophorus hellerii]XP_032415534.1 uncharacterized protein LOC116717955 [Xiphophorus hellerii]